MTQARSLQHVLSAALIWAAGGLTGVFIARFAWPSARTATDATNIESMTPARGGRVDRRGLVCVREIPSRGSAVRDDETDDEAAAMARLRLGICEAKLDECTRAKALVRHPWPEQGAGVEDPTQFRAVVEQALADCDLDDGLEMIECSEYPCVAALRPTAGDDQAALDRLNLAIDACAPLRQAFDIGDGQDDALEAHSVRIPCTHGDRVAHVLAAVSTKGEAWNAWQNRGTGDNAIELLRWMFRRSDDVAALWNCDPE